MSAYLITGCSRGLGLQLVKTLAQTTLSQAKVIFATSRSSQPSEALLSIINNSPDRVKFIQLDPANPQSISQAVSQTHQGLNSHSLEGLDVLINNAATQSAEPGGARAMHSLQSTLTANVIAVHEVTSAFLPLLQNGQGKKIINISSSLGSIAIASELAFAAVSSYKISKTALNMLTVQYALDLKEEGFTVVAVSPGNLRTEIGGSGAGMSAAEGAEKVLEVVENLMPKDNGAFRDIFVEGSEVYKGGEIPW